MKFATAAVLLLSVLSNVESLPTVIPETTVSASLTIVASEPTGNILEKRWKQVIQPNKDYENKLSQKKSIELAKPKEVPKSWLRTISSTVREVVHPTVIAGVTFSAKPPATTNGLEPWVSLNKDGTPKTIRPQNKNGQIKNGKPDYGTWFQEAKTVVHDQKDLKAHNLKENEVFEEIVYEEEDQTYVSLNPLLRCTPDRYYMKGLGKDISSSPFCTPREGSNLKLGTTYFITWFTKHFPKTTEAVRLHFAYIKEKESEKGMNKREWDYSGEGQLPGTFFTSDWILNRDGYFPLDIQEAWLKNKYNKKVLITIQPDTIPDDEFDLLNSNGTVVTFMKGAIVAKTTKEQKLLEDLGGSADDNIYYVILAMPTMVILAACGMYFFVFITRGSRDFSAVKKAYFKKRFGKRKNYDKLPQHKADVALKRLD